MFFLCCRPTCTFKQPCFDRLHEVCLFSRNELDIAHCMYVDSRHDIRSCSSQACNDKSIAHRKNWRIQLGTIYARSRLRRCFRPIACIQNMPLKKSGYRAVAHPVVSTTPCHKLSRINAVFIFSLLRPPQWRRSRSPQISLQTTTKPRQSLHPHS